MSALLQKEKEILIDLVDEEIEETQNLLDKEFEETKVVNETIESKSPIQEPYAPLTKLYVSQNGQPKSDTRRIHFSSSIQNALV